MQLKLLNGNFLNTFILKINLFFKSFLFVKKLNATTILSIYKCFVFSLFFLQIPHCHLWEPNKGMNAFVKNDSRGVESWYDQHPKLLKINLSNCSRPWAGRINHSKCTPHIKARAVLLFKFSYEEYSR